VQTWSIDENELGIIAMNDPADRVPSGLRLTRRDGNLLPHQRIGQSGLTRIGSTNEAGESRSEI
jgi:hypothetical protein